MKKTLILLSATLILSGCATLMTATRTICEQQETIRGALLLAMQNTDSPTRQNAIRVILSALEECPNAAR